jgi:2-methylisocitrate lyase-like PEP mutase family enzyme
MTSHHSHSMPDLAARASALRALHRPGAPLVLRNAWDPASAKTLVADAPALATTSVGVAESLGYADGGHLPAEDAFAALGRIVAAVDVPVTADCEAGYGLEPAAFVEGLLGAGAVGCNLEDTDHATGGLRDPGEHAIFLAAVKEAGRAAGVDLVLNARVDVHLRGGTLEDGLARARAYRAAGADCVYPIFCHEEEGIAAYVEAVGVVNVAVHPSAPSIERMAQLGVARASFGARLFHVAMKAAGSYEP